MSEQSLTYESIMKMIRGIARRQKETDRQMKKHDAEYALMRKELNRKIGELTGSIGRMVEHMLGEGILDKFRALGYEVDDYTRNHRYRHSKLGIKGEIDLILHDGDVSILIEVKTTLETSHVRKHLKKIEEYRNHIATEGFVQPHVRHLLPNTRFIGAVAGAVVTDEAKDFALENGLYVIVQSGDAVEIVPTPEGFKAKEW